MVTTDEREMKRDGSTSDSVVPVGSWRRDLPGWQAQLIAIAVTIAMVVGLVLLFSLLTGTF